MCTFLTVFVFSCAENKKRSNRTYIRIWGDVYRSDLKALGVELGEQPFPKFVIIANGELRCSEDAVDEDLGSLIAKHGKA